jgi:hypothetical protein
MVIVADAELTSAKPPAIAIAFANHFVCFFICLCSQLITPLLQSTSVRPLYSHSVFLRYRSQAPPR